MAGKQAQAPPALPPSFGPEGPARYSPAKQGLHPYAWVIERMAKWYAEQAGSASASWAWHSRLSVEPAEW